MEIPISETIEKRFWKKVAMRTECWLWEGATNSDGYGVQKILGKQYLVHRLGWQLFNGATDKQLIHSCGNRLCVRDSHLEPVLTGLTA